MYLFSIIRLTALPIDAELILSKSRHRPKSSCSKTFFIIGLGVPITGVPDASASYNLLGEQYKLFKQL